MKKTPPSLCPFISSSPDPALPTGLWVEAECAKLNANGQGYYIAHRGNYASGVVMVKVYDRLQRQCMLYIQQRDLDGVLGWARVLGTEPLAEGEVDRYIQRALSTDPDLWVIDIEADTPDNPFEGQIID